MTHSYSILIEKTDTQAGCPHMQLSRAHMKSCVQRCLYKEQKAHVPYWVGIRMLVEYAC